MIDAGLGRPGEALAWLNRAFDDRSYPLAVYLTTNARLDSFHGDPRCDELRRRVGLPKINGS